MNVLTFGEVLAMVRGAWRLLMCTIWGHKPNEQKTECLRCHETIS